MGGGGGGLGGGGLGRAFGRGGPGGSVGRRRPGGAVWGGHATQGQALVNHRLPLPPLALDSFLEAPKKNFWSKLISAEAAKEIF